MSGRLNGRVRVSQSRVALRIIVVKLALSFAPATEGTACSWYGGARYRIITRG